MGYLGRRIGLSQDNGDSNPGAAGGTVGGGLLDLFAHGYFERQGALYNAPGSGAVIGLSATGGIISDYTSGSDVYRAHVFTSSGALNVTEVGNQGGNVDYLCVAGGGGNQSSPAGSNRESGSGAGGLLSSHPDVPATFKQTQATISSTGNINIVVGGGAGSKTQGSPSSIAFSSPVSTVGGGHGANQDGQVGGPGGSGGGNWYSSSTPGQATNYPGPNQQGYPGGTQGGTNNWTGGAGGGAGAQGADNGASYSAGRTISITGSAVEYSRGGKSNSYPSTSRSENGIFNTGGGASGVGNGGSGIVVISYKIAEITATAKATGGNISFYGGKTIHAFTNSGVFAAPGSFSETCEYVVIGSGGGGGKGYNNDYGSSGAGAGAYRTNSVAVSSGNYPVTIGAGGAGAPGPNNSQLDGFVGNTTTLNLPSAIASPGGGKGRYSSTSGGQVGGAGGSGGGGSGRNPGAAGGPAPGSTTYPGTIGATPSSSWWGHAGGTAAPSNDNAGAGGGGAGGVGGNAGPTNRHGGDGGIGIQLPATFRDPTSGVGAPGPTSAPTPNGYDTSGKYWVAGGGGGYGHDDRGVGGAGGGGNSGSPRWPSPAIPGTENTGSGGGAGGAYTTGYAGGSGGSGFVLIAYPT